MAGAGNITHYKSRPRKIFLHGICDEPSVSIITAAWRCRNDVVDGLILVEIGSRFSEGQCCRKTQCGDSERGQKPLRYPAHNMRPSCPRVRVPSCASAIKLSMRRLLIK